MKDDPSAVDPQVFHYICVMLYRYPLYFGERPQTAMSQDDIHELLSAACLQTAIARIVPPSKHDFHFVMDDEGVPTHINKKMKLRVFQLRDELMQQTCEAWQHMYW